MSCIRFNTKSQRQEMREYAKHAPSPDPIPFSSPAMGPSKLRRLCLLAADPNPKIRERVALDYYAGDELLTLLSHDPDDGVRSCVARNETTSCSILRELAADPAESVRGFVALSWAVPVDVIAVLAEDPSETVRKLVDWKAQQLAE